MEASRPWCLADNSTPSQVILPSPLCPSKNLETKLCFRGKIEVFFSSFRILVSLLYFYFWLFGFFSRSRSQWGFQKMHEEHCSKSIRRWIRLSCPRREPKLTANIRHPSYFHLSCIVNSTQMYAMWWNAQTRSRIECLVKHFLDSLVAHEPAIEPLSMARSSILRFCWVHISVYFPCSQSLGQYNRWFKESLQEVPGVQRKIELEGTSSFQWRPEE
jgi:hypothetical protein